MDGLTSQEGEKKKGMQPTGRYDGEGLPRRPPLVLFSCFLLPSIWLSGFRSSPVLGAFIAKRHFAPFFSSPSAFSFRREVAEKGGGASCHCGVL